MATLESTPSLPQESSKMGGGGRLTKTLFRSISSKEPSFSELLFSPARLSTSDVDPPIPSISPLSPLPPSIATKHEKFRSTHQCISSMLKKDGRILSIAVINGLIYTGSESNCIRIWKLPEFTECGRLQTKSGMVCALAVSSDRIFAAYADCKIRVWRRLWHDKPSHVRIATIPKIGSYVRNYITGGKDKKMMKHLGAISSLAVNASDDLLYSASIDKTVKVWRISDLKCIETIEAHSEPINAVAVGDDGVLYTASDDATIRVWRRNFCSSDRPHSLTVTLPAKNSPVKALALTADGGVLYGGCTDGYIHYWLKGWLSGQLQYGGALSGHSHAVMCLSSVANYVVSGSADSTSRVWMRERDGQHTCLTVLQGHRGPVKCVSAFTSDRGGGGGAGDCEDRCTVCTGSLDGVLKLWQVTCITSTNVARNSKQSGHDYFDL
ncbi:PREDICTED: uncharacterized protein LOC104592122 [Nelumbo nucifera]|uniref:Uncharacterized protein LOC104592122 n=2 Tax=Nelumbo nucifera TaxID=4432 RepID=A0A1U7Z892_NELNU|nr:PREDICTED: uncharacterized protein LOC104592122 [Nelumbo nucifera]DAD35592.1 TPA_asm: hypothetical protein HUJ06_006232 [Nelumbo nucifera]